MSSHERSDRALATNLWASASYLLFALLMAALFVVAFALVAAKPSSPELHPLIDTPTEVLEDWGRMLADLCSDPELVAMDMRPDCATGVIELPHKLFFDFKSSEVSQEGRQRLARALPIILAKLRERDLLWQNVEAIEIRGHADPRATRDVYATNLQQSTERALEVLRFLTQEGVLAERDRADLQRLAIASGASYVRPPDGCQIDSTSQDCFARWRRAELRIDMNDGLLRSAQSELLERVRDFVPAQTGP